MNAQVVKGETLRVILVDEKTKTVYVEGKGKATSTGKLNIEGFIDKAMSLPSFWR